MATGSEPLPGQDIASTLNTFVEKIKENAYRILNNTGATITQGDYVLIHGLLGIANQTALNGAYFDLLVDGEIEVQADDLVTGALTFGTIYQTVYFNQALGQFSDLPGYGIPIGILSKIKDAQGIIKFFNLKKRMVLAGETETIELEVAVDASAGITFPLGYDYKILDVVAYCTAANAGGTVTLSDGAAAISDAMIIAVANTRVAAATIDETKNTITDAEVLTVTTNGAADRCRMLLTVKAV
jgi:hypothetical protein